MSLSQAEPALPICELAVVNPTADYHDMGPAGIINKLNHALD